MEISDEAYEYLASNVSIDESTTEETTESAEQMPPPPPPPRQSTSETLDTLVSDGTITTDEIAAA